MHNARDIARAPDALPNISASRWRNATSFSASLHWMVSPFFLLALPLFLAPPRVILLRPGVKYLGRAGRRKRDWTGGLGSISGDARICSVLSATPNSSAIVSKVCTASSFTATRVSCREWISEPRLSYRDREIKNRFTGKNSDKLRARYPSTLLFRYYANRHYNIFRKNTMTNVKETCRTSSGFLYLLTKT